MMFLVVLVIWLVDFSALFVPVGTYEDAYLSTIQADDVVISARTDVLKYSLSYLLQRILDTFQACENEASCDLVITQ